MPLTYRLVKGAPISAVENDANLAALHAGIGVQTRADLVAWLADNEVEDGQPYFAGRHAYVGATGSTEIADLPGLTPLWHACPWHYGDDPGGDEWEAADAWALGQRGRVVYVDEVLTLDRPVTLQAPHHAVTGRIELASDFAGVAGGHCIRLGDDSATLNDGELDAEFFIDGRDYFGKAKATWLPSGGSFPSGSTADDGYKALDSGTVGGVQFYEGDILKALVTSASTSIYAGNWLRVPTGLAFTAAWAPSGGSFPSGATFEAIYRASDYGTVNSINFRPGDYIIALVDGASTTTWAGNWARRYNGISAVRLDGTARGMADLSIKAQYCDIALNMRGNTEKMQAAVSAFFCHGAYFEYSYEDGAGGASSLDNVEVAIRGSSCGWWSWCEGTSLTEIHCLFQNQLSNYSVPAIRDYATRVRTYSGVCRTPRYSPAIHIWQRTSPENSGTNWNDFEIANPIGTGQQIFAEYTNAGSAALDRGGNSLTGRIRMATANGGVTLEQEKGSCLSIVSNNQTGGIPLVLGSTSKGSTSSLSRFTVVLEGSTGATGGVNFDNASGVHVDYGGVAVAVTATTVARCSIALPASFITGAVAYPSVTGLAVDFPAARKAFRTTASGDGVTVTFNLGGGGTGGNSYARTSYIVLPGNTYTAGLNFAIIAPDSDGNARVTFTAAPALGTDNLAFEVLIS